MNKKLLTRILSIAIAFTILFSDISAFAASGVTGEITQVQPEESVVVESSQEESTTEVTAPEITSTTENNMENNVQTETETQEERASEAEVLEQEETAVYTPYWEEATFSNLIVFVDFADTVQEHTYNAETLSVFNGDEENPQGMRRYLHTISYEELKVENIFPQYDEEADEVEVFVLENNAEFYVEEKSALIEEVVELLNNSELLIDGMILDYGNDESLLDHLTIVVPCEEGNSNSLFITHTAKYTGEAKIGEDRISNYQIVTETDLCYTEDSYLLLSQGIAEVLGFIREENPEEEEMPPIEEEMSSIEEEAMPEAQEDILTGLQTIDGKSYIYNDSGEVFTGYFEYNSQKYYADSNGVLKSGWIKLGAVWRYFDKDNGYCETEGETLDGCWYYLEDGKISYFTKKTTLVQDSWRTINKKKYYFDNEGFAVKGWYQDGAYWYYADENGQMVQGCYTIGEGENAKTYYFDSNCRLSTGWKKIGGVYRYFNPDQDNKNCYEIELSGTSGLVDASNERKCYIDKKKGAVTGWKTIGAYRYHFDSDGFMDTGLFQDGRYHYYAETEETATEESPIGNVVKGVRKIGDKVYGFHASKYYRLSGWQTIGKNRYYFTNDYNAVIGWYKEGNYWYYAEPKADTEELQTVPEGSMAKGEKVIGDKTYYFDSKYRLTTGWVKINNQWRYFEKAAAPQECYEVDYKNEGGWVTLLDGTDSRKSYINAKNSLLKGWQTINKKRYYFDKDGFLKTGWYDDGKYIYFAETVETAEEPSLVGTPVKGEQTIDGKTYYFDRNYRLKTGWMKLNNVWRYFNHAVAPEASYEIKYEVNDGWITLLDGSGRKSYLKSNKIFKGWLTIEGKKYYFNSSGIMETGWFTVGSSKYYADENGVLQQGGSDLKSWQEIEGKIYYFNSKGQLTKGFKTIAGKKYYFDSNGVLQSGWFNVAKNVYYGEPEGEAGGTLGVIAKGAREIDGETYVFHSSSYYRLKGFQSSGGKRYYLQSDGTAKTGWFTVGTDLYYGEPSTVGGVLKGTLASGAKEIKDGNESTTYFFHAKSNYRLTGWQTINKKRYYLNSDGTARTGWFTVKGKIYYAEPETEENGTLKGTVAQGAKEIDGETYVFHASKYYRLTGWQTVNKKRYYLDSDGTARTDWFKIGGKWYYGEPQTTEENGLKGTLATGFQTITYVENEKSVERTYYFDKSYRLVTGWQTIGKVRYFFNKDSDPKKCYQVCQGPSTKGWFTFTDGRKSYLNNKGKFVTGWQTIEKKKYYFDSAGIMQTGWCTISGKAYYFNSEGVYIPMTTPTFVSLTSTAYGAVDVKWKLIDGVQNYTLEYSQNNVFPSWETASILIKDPNVSTYGIEDLEPDTTYYFRLRYTAWSGDDENADLLYSQYSAVKSIVVRGEVAATSTSATISDCQITSGSRDGGIAVQLKANLKDRLKSADDKYYIVETESYGNAIDLATPVGSVEKAFEIDTEFVIDQGDGSDDVQECVDRALMNKFALAVLKNDGTYQVISTPMGITNPEAVSENTAPILVPTSKKGLQGIGYKDALNTNSKNTLFNLDLAAVVGTGPASGYVEYEYKGKTYYFSDCSNLVGEFKKLEEGIKQYIQGETGKNNKVAVTLNLLLSYKSSNAYLIDPAARTKGHKYYTLNMREEKARETFEAVFLYLGELFGQSDCYVTHWVLGNEVNSSRAWNYQGSLSFDTYMKSYATAFRLLYNGVKAEKTGNNVYISLDNGWTAAPDTYAGKSTLDKFAAYAQKENPDMLWSIAYHGYSYPLTKCDFWNDNKNTTNSLSTKYISMKNIYVLTDYVATLEQKYDKPEGSIRVILSEQGYNAGKGHYVQAQALARGYYMAEFNDRIDAFIIRAIIDDRDETKGGLYLGLQNIYQEKRIAFYTYEYMDSSIEKFYATAPNKIASSTQNQQKVKQAQQIIGETNWESLIPGFSESKLAGMY